MRTADVTKRKRKKVNFNVEIANFTKTEGQKIKVLGRDRFLLISSQIASVFTGTARIDGAEVLAFTRTRGSQVENLAVDFFSLKISKGHAFIIAEVVCSNNLRLSLLFSRDAANFPPGLEELPRTLF